MYYCISCLCLRPLSVRDPAPPPSQPKESPHQDTGKGVQSGIDVSCKNNGDCGPHGSCDAIAKLCVCERPYISMMEDGRKVPCSYEGVREIFLWVTLAQQNTAMLPKFSFIVPACIPRHEYILTLLHHVTCVPCSDQNYAHFFSRLS